MSRIAIFTPNRGSLETEMVLSLISMIYAPQYKEAGVDFGVYFVTGDSLISRARNDCADIFLRGDADALMFIDSDMVFEPLEVLRLWETNLSLVGANYHVTRRSILTKERRAVVPIPEGNPELCAVSRVPTGFLMIRRECFTKMVENSGLETYRVGDRRQVDFFSPFVNDSEYLSEDYAFIVRARRVGITPHIHQGIALGHIGRHEWRVEKEAAHA